MKEPICPRVGTPCLGHECLFYVQIPAHPEKYVCRDELRDLINIDIANQLQLILKSTEQHRETVVQTLRTKYTGHPTEEFKRLTGMSGDAAYS